MRFSKRVINSLSLTAAFLSLSFGANAMNQGQTTQTEQMMSQTAQEPCKMQRRSWCEDKGGVRKTYVKHNHVATTTTEVTTHYTRYDKWEKGTEVTEQPKCSKIPVPGKQEQCWVASDAGQQQAACGNRKMETKHQERQEDGTILTRTIVSYDNEDCYTVVEVRTSILNEQWEDDVLVEAIVPSCSKSTTQCAQAAPTGKTHRHKGDK